ncbi:MAG: hypothetical protein IT423_08585, partial [Pirellulaceae bacterium]|nr:hypothetical protein [Pirellulaceae bacterium]
MVYRPLLAQDNSPVRTDIHISGIYPHLTTYGIYSQNGAHRLENHNECGIGAIVPWAGKLWMVNYAPHMPKGSEHKLFSVDPDLSQPLTVHPESVGGTPAGRMLHRESNQLLIAHYLIDSSGTVRVISPKQMPMRVTAIARHLKDPANMVYYIDMEGAIWEANVHTLAVKRLFEKPVPGWHSKGGYTSQGRLVISNNGELPVGNYSQVLVGGKSNSPDEAGVLAQWDGQQWSIVERRQFTEVTGPSGLAGGSDGQEPIWAVGWDRRSLRLKVLDDGQWHTYLLPKAAYCNDARHGWYTEWPRIREITDGQWMMDMHGMFYKFPKTMSAKNSAGVSPIASHLRYVPDFCQWQGKLVLATDETSIQGNELAGQPQSNLWIGQLDDLKQWGPANGYGGPWLDDKVTANVPSDPYLIAGFARRWVHMTVSKDADSADQAVEFTLEINQHGDDQWTEFKKVQVIPGGYTGLALPSDLSAVWLRFKAGRDCTATVFLHQTASRYIDGQTEENRQLFAGLANVDQPRVTSETRVYAAKHNRNLQVLSAGDRLHEFTKAQFEFTPSNSDPALAKKLQVKPIFTVDMASVLIESNGKRYRLPKGNAAYDQPFAIGWPRAIREVQSERQLANIHGTFYEVPLVTNSAPPAFARMRPVASHAKRISDYCSWNGLLVLAGARTDAAGDPHVFVDAQRQLALWFGGIDDLWRLGKPIGQGGPWSASDTKAGQASDPYLMTGYDEKTMTLSHIADKPVTFRVELDITGAGHWVTYRTFDVPAQQSVVHRFPTGLSA